MKAWTDELLTRAYDSRAEDIHIMPEREQYALYFRINGELERIQTFPLADGERWIRYMKFIANMDIGERRLPQDGSMIYTLKSGSIELRLSTISNYLLRESLAIRLLYPNSAGVIHDEPENSAINRLLWRTVHKKSGFMIFSGPVSSGKTTTIYRLLEHLYAEAPKNIITMEDPVEIKNEHFLQVEINDKAGVTYERVIRASLRHHPDVLLIGEIRDPETARMAIRAALTGHLVIATLHAKNCFGVVGRLYELGITKEQLLQTVLLVTSQRLVPLAGDGAGRGVLYEALTARELSQWLRTGTAPATFQSFNHVLKEAVEDGRITQAVADTYALEENFEYLRY